MTNGRLAQSRVGVLGSGEVGGAWQLGFNSWPRRDDRLTRPGQIPVARMAVGRWSWHRGRHPRRDRRAWRSGARGVGKRGRGGDRRDRPRQLQRQGRDRRDEPARLLRGFPPKLSITGEDSLGERVQRALPDAKVVKAFNTIGNPYFVDPSFGEGQPTMLIAGDDEGAKRTVGDVLGLRLGQSGGHRRYRGLSRARGDLHRVGQDRWRTRLVGPRVQAARRLAGGGEGKSKGG